MIKNVLNCLASLLARIFPNVGTRSVLFGVHQFLFHPITVWLAWFELYGFPNFWETAAIVLHDIGYIGKRAMDDNEGELHPAVGAQLILKLRYFFGGTPQQANELAVLVAFHSRYLAARYNQRPTKLCWADKLCLKYDPMWFYLLRASLSGEIKEYRLNGLDYVPASASNRVWFKWLRAKCIDVARQQLPGHNRRAAGK
jgi:hypothetical protein